MKKPLSLLVLIFISIFLVNTSSGVDRMQRLQNAAENGDINAQYELGMHYLEINKKGLPGKLQPF